MKIIALIAALAASSTVCLATVSARAADWACEGEASDWPGTMTVTLTVSDSGQLKAGHAGLRLGSAQVQYPFAVIGYDLVRPEAAALGPVSDVTIGAMVESDKPPRSKTAHITLVVDERVWDRPWGMYAERGWEAEEAVGFVGMIRSEATSNGLGRAIEAGQFMVVRVVGDEGDELIATRQHALPSRAAAQRLADAAYAKALAAAADYRKACEVVKDEEG